MEGKEEGAEREEVQVECGGRREREHRLKKEEREGSEKDGKWRGTGGR